MKKALALILSTTAMLFLASGVVVGCGSDDDDDGNPNDDAGANDAGTDAASDAQTDSSLPPITGASPFGDFCDTDADCEDGLTCLTATGDDWLGGGPAGGYCSLSCADDSRVCQDFPNSICVPSGASAAYCLEVCQNGPVSPLDDDKCHNRVNSACSRDASGIVSACFPACGNDKECPEGRYCDLVSGVCLDDKPEGLPLGSQCDPDAEEDPCSGVCLTLGPDYSVCTGFCTFGSPGACDVDPSEPAPTGAGLCYPVFGEDDSVGDVGVCIQRCDCNGTCLSSESACDPLFLEEGLEEAFQANGLCFPGAEDFEGLACEAGDGGPDSGPSPSDAGGDGSAADAADAG